MHKKLFIPGPIDVREDVLQKMATPQIGHRTKEASALQRSVSEKLMKVFQTKNQIILSTSSGSGLMEGAIRSCTRKRAAVFSVGAFGDRWFKMAKANGVPADKISSVPGKPTTPEMVDEALATGKYDVITVTQNETSAGIMNPCGEIGELLKKKYPDVLYLIDTVSSMGGTDIRVDEWGADVCITSTQKCLGLPAGMSACSISERAVEAARQVENRGMYFDLVELYDFIQKKDHQYPSTPSLAHMFAMDYQLDKILAEGLEKRFARHIEMAEYVRAWARKNFALFVEDEKYLSNTLTTVTNTIGIDVGGLNKKLGERGFMISNGYGDLKDKTFRISHMGDYTLGEVKELIKNINEILGL
ncbi:MAG TPA: alanine--glyoxylate aminotransferase family protein [Bacillota bacterium]|nr:alanine--glyoxylate aminotransferase family protein [Bacillota bacterium]HNT04032.1 alanine--glyoxylate aminotransferase family protein [Bacillota bacterium]HPX69437.1 alanine--glyoxylate aminotransferase family protein [Bacillota bacterium]HQA66508.1 alanine--glyoxylate aminotransferase family protein [Bacillota bacterium]HQO42974.1 alanine--glyoxylate aminotransferase family protein [Bacillota bacterium]